MSRRLPPAALGAVALALVLTGCTAPASTLDDARVWVDEAQHADVDRSDVIGNAVIPAEPESGREGSDEPSGIIIDFPAPGVHVDAFEVSCYGGGTASLEFELSATTSSHAGGAEVPCDEEPHEIVPSGEREGITIARVDVTADPATFAYVAVIGTEPAAADPWEGHFTDRAAELDSGSGVSWGSFGLEEEVSPVGWTDASLPPGDHVVTVECAAAVAFPIDVALSQGEALPDEADAQELTCPGAATYPFTTDAEGLSVTLDSRGEPGAYLVAIDVAP
ncbi:UNVERIFIED_CONTAM: hypothetical protein OHV15_13180 [Microbacterium sp. SLM126]